MYKHKNGIILRKLEREDLPKLKALKDESWFGTHSIAIVNMDDQNKWFDSLGSKNIVMVAYKEPEVWGRGNIGLYKISNIDWVNRRYDSAHDIFKDERGKGYGKLLLEAGVDFGFEVLNMNRIDTEVLENNKASQKTATFAGFIQEGIKRKCVHKCGEWVDSIFYGLLRSEWEQLERVKKMGICNLSYTPKNG